jgi:uncharacterized RDD family membrane protein YckC
MGAHHQRRVRAFAHSGYSASVSDLGSAPDEDARVASANEGVQARQTPGELLPRLLARIVDFVLLGIPSLVLTNVSGIGDGWVAPQVVLFYAYFVLLDTYIGTTVGKRFLGLRVTGPTGDKPRMKQAAIREAFILLDFMRVPWVGSPLSLAAWIVIIVTIRKSPTRQGKHDQIAGGTYVIDA